MGQNAESLQNEINNYYQSPERHAVKAMNAEFLKVTAQTDRMLELLIHRDITIERLSSREKEMGERLQFAESRNLDTLKRLESAVSIEMSSQQVQKKLEMVIEGHEKHIEYLKDMSNNLKELQDQKLKQKIEQLAIANNKNVELDEANLKLMKRKEDFLKQNELDKLSEYIRKDWEISQLKAENQTKEILIKDLLAELSARDEANDMLNKELRNAQLKFDAQKKDSYETLENLKEENYRMMNKQLKEEKEEKKVKLLGSMYEPLKHEFCRSTFLNKEHECLKEQIQSAQLHDKGLPNVPPSNLKRPSYDSSEHKMKKLRLSRSHSKDNVNNGRYENDGSRNEGNNKLIEGKCAILQPTATQTERRINVTNDFEHKDEEVGAKSFSKGGTKTEDDGKNCDWKDIHNNDKNTSANEKNDVIDLSESGDEDIENSDE